MRQSRAGFLLRIPVDPHPLLDAPWLVARLPAGLVASSSPPWLQELLLPDAPAPLQRSEEVRAAVRDLLRHGGFKPTGRSKPASEYLARAAEEGVLAPINPVVDAVNVASLHSGLPLSVVDAELTMPPLRIAIAAPGSRYVFNASGQEIDVAGLACLHDADGPCASPVKDSQRTKTRAQTASVIVVAWGTLTAPGLAKRTLGFAGELLARLGAEVEG